MAANGELTALGFSSAGAISTKQQAAHTARASTETATQASRARAERTTTVKTMEQTHGQRTTATRPAGAVVVVGWAGDWQHSAGVTEGGDALRFIAAEGCPVLC